MRQLFIVLGFIAAILAVVLAVTALSDMAYIPVVAALVFALIAFYLSKQKQQPKKSVHLIFLLTAIALVLTSYKSIFNTAEVVNGDEVELKEETSIEESKEELDLEMEDSDLEPIETEDPEGLQEQ